MIYFAYGSNLNPAQMARRCPGARPAGRAVLHDWRLILTTRGTANIVPSHGRVVHGGLWRFTPKHLSLMDRWEGVSRRANRRTWLRATCPDGQAITIVTYVGVRTAEGIGLSHYILNTMLPGARAFALPQHYHDEIQSWLSPMPIGAARRYIGRRARR